VCILPAALWSGRTGRSRWDGLVIAVACTGLAVVELRLRATWPGTG
jgi:hypothetical protein